MRVASRDLRRAIDLLTAEGGAKFARRVARRLYRLVVPRSYAAWIRRYDRPVAPQRLGSDARCGAPPGGSPPTIDLLMPEAGDPAGLAATATSLQRQTAPDWRLLIALGPATPPAALRAASTVAEHDRRIRLVRTAPEPDSADADGFAAAANRLLAEADGSFVALLGAGDALAPDAVAAMQRAVARPDTVLAFSDEDVLRRSRLPWRRAVRADPWFKPDFNPALMLGCDAVGRLAVLRRDRVVAVGGIRPGFCGAEEYDLVLRYTRGLPAAAIRHVPRILCHRPAEVRHPGGWRRVDGAAAARRAAAEHLAAIGTVATLEPGPAGNRVVLAAPRTAPRVSVLVATTGRPAVAARCFHTLLKGTDYQALEVLVLVSEAATADPERAAFLDGLAADARVRLVVGPDRPFNYSEVNNRGAAQATGDVLCLLNDDTEALRPDWLAGLAARVAQPGVAAAGAMLLYPDGTIQHAGVLLGLGGVAGHVGHREPRGSAGPFGRLALEQDVAAVTAACMAVRTEVFRAVGGLDEGLPLAYNDVDLCLRIRRAGWRIVWTPAAELVHHESASLGRHDTAHAIRFAEDVRLMRHRWGPDLDADPYYNANLSLDRAYALAFPPRQRSGGADGPGPVGALTR
ncbi:glycosyltransferase family 2 protein [Rhodoplanes roseus]|uniref:glycosyltransferase family 2 protein n=1 Tax=Rhodoplanes roseus TaxID=29409 RepID=UPI0011B666E3|nr:glycosyltransferase [Rhodoplanes roseus]